MSTGNTSRDEADLETFLARRSPISLAYEQLEPLEPPANVDQKVFAIALASARPVAAVPRASKPGAMAGEGAAAVRAAVATADNQDDTDDQPPPARRPRWLVPAALAAGVLVAVGVGVAMLGNGPSDPEGQGTLASIFARRVRERIAADKAASEAAAVPEAELSRMTVEPLPPPPVFEPEGPQVEDLGAAITLIRKELVLANQIAATQEDGGPAGPSVIQPRARRLTKIIDLYDGGNPDLAADSLEIFLRDFEDDPVSQRILGITP